ncbi:MAG: DNA replication/repair protein RecF [Dehalococcoidia bacterium]|nr:DNA replication/repair protein RecF [Dehalococcoidia bacterium]
MYLSRLSLTNYRNFLSLELKLPPGLVFVVGDNAQGKSNLLEAAYLLAIAKSYRTNVERELIHWSAQKPAATLGSQPAQQTIIHGEVQQQSGSVRIIVGLRVVSEAGAGGALVEKQVRVNGVPTTAAGLVGRVNAVLFAATDIELVHGPPAQRRRFLDILISQVDRAYLRTLQRYQRVLTQRNHLLRLIREGRSSPDDLDFWDSELVKEGTALIAQRSQIVQQLAPLATRAYRGLAVEEEMSVEYQPSVAADALAGAIASQRAAEIKAGMTLPGPHRDELGLTIDGVPANTYASRGQARTTALALRLAEAALLRQERRDEPILLLDDVLSELDPARRRHVLEEAAGYQQALITSAEPEALRDMPVKPAAVFTLRKGQMEPQGPA